MFNYTHPHRSGSFRFAAASLLAVVALVGCASDAQTGTLVGSGAGAGIGAIVGHQSGYGAEGALIGAGVGAIGGYMIGNESDKQKDRRYRHRYDY